MGLDPVLVGVFFVFALVLAWFGIKRQGQRGGREFSSLRRSYVLFVVFFACLLAVFFLGRETAGKWISERPVLGALAIILVITLICFLVLTIIIRGREMERPVVRGLAGRALIMILAAALPIVVFRIMESRFDVVVVALATLAGAVVGMCILAWNLYKHWHDV